MRAVRGAVKKMRGVLLPLAPPQLVVFAHRFTVIDGCTCCERCHRGTSTAAGLCKLKALPCLPYVPERAGDASRAHSSHCLRVSAGVLWCLRCGRYASKQMKALVEPCSQPSEWGAKCIHRFKAGIHPDPSREIRYLGPSVAVGGSVARP